MQDEPNTASTAPFSPENSVETEPFNGEIEALVVANHEVIDRSIQLKTQFFCWGEGEEIRVSASAFNDRNYEPSFFREALCDNPPYMNPPRMNPDDAVASITAGRVRNQDAIVFRSGNEEATEHRVDVRSETDGQHKAHVVIFAAPEFKTKGGFARLKELLARIVGSNWAIQPNGGFLKENQDKIPKA